MTKGHKKESRYVNHEALNAMIKNGELSTKMDFDELIRNVSKSVLEAMFDGEMTDHLGYEKYDQTKKETDNSRNGFNRKNVDSKFGKIELDVPRDRNSEYEPQIVKKRQRTLGGFDDMIISMYAKGMSSRDIQKQMNEIYNYEISPESVSIITDKVIDKAREWQSRPLQRMYAVVFIDALFCKVRRDGQVKNIAVYLMLGIDLQGRKECLGIWVLEKETSREWLNVFNEVKNRGVEDVLIFATDGLTGISEAIRTAYPEAEIQKCIVHQIRNSLKHVSYKDRKDLANDMKRIYNASTESAALVELENFEKTWNKKYPYISKSWYRHWDELAVFFKYPDEVRRLIYTTNSIESLNNSLRKATRNRVVFPNDGAIFKVLYLSVQEVSKKWTSTIRNWALIFSQLSVYFEERIEKYING